MTSVTGLERFLEAADYEARRRGGSSVSRAHRPVITVSRKAGSGAHVVAQELVGRLQARDPKASPPWTVFDRDLVAEVLREHHLPDRFAGSMPEDRVSEIADTLDGLFGLRPSSWTLVRKTAETILHLAEIGNVIVIGRGANILTDRFADALHVRLVGSVR
ncbi:MAG TPA: cytidylate kinase family protein, partial [Actinomycetota bacterium]